MHVLGSQDGIVGQVSKVDAGENLDAEIGSNASDLNRGAIFGLGCDCWVKSMGIFFVVYGKDLL